MDVKGLILGFSLFISPWVIGFTFLDWFIEQALTGNGIFVLPFGVYAVIAVVLGGGIMVSSQEESKK